MLRLFLSLFLMALFSCQPAEPARPGIIPQPASIECQEGRFTINEATTLVTNNTEAGQKHAELLRSFFRDRFQLDLEISTKEHLRERKDKSEITVIRAAGLPLLFSSLVVRCSAC